MENIHIIVTGGTFDKEYNFINGELYFRETHLKQLLQEGRSQLEVRISQLMLKDSLEMTTADRELIAASCNASEETRIVITHGTDTMTETARLLADKVKNKTVVITGAMIPIKFGSSDGLFNLGSALAFSQSLLHGIYIAMNGRYFDWDNVKKNRKSGVFEEIK